MTSLKTQSGDDAGAAFDEAIGAAVGTRSLIAREIGAMTAAWDEPTARADELETHRTAIAAVVKSYQEQLDKFFAVYGYSDRPGEPEAYDLPEPVLRRDSQGWSVNGQILSWLKQDITTANRAGVEASRKMLAGKPRREVREATVSLVDTLHSLEQRAAQLGEQRDAILRERDEDVASRRVAAEQAVESEMAKLTAVEHLLPAGLRPWADPAWLDWSPEFTHSMVLLGSFRLRFGALPGPINGFASNVKTPVFASVRDGLHISHRRDEREKAVALARSLVLRALASTPPGKLRLSIFDPTGLGQSVASLLELGEYDRELIGGKVWSSNEDLHRLLAEATGQIEQVIQKYLRAEYDTLAEFNAAAGEIAEPYRMVIIFDAPTGFDERSVAELQRIAENGPRCGIATLLLSDEDLQAPFGVSLDALPSSLARIRLGQSFVDSEVSSDVQFDLLPETDAEAPKEVVASLVGVVGRSTQEATATTVGFDKIFDLFVAAALEGRKRDLPRLTAPLVAADPESWWTQSTIRGVAAPIGQRGARDVATLSFDSSDHAGALLVGRPGSGKSTLLHSFIRGATTMYGPEELELHLIDFKEGVEFKVYAAEALPHARTVAIESDREFGVSVLEAINEELRWRASLLRGSAESHSSLESLRAATGDPLPRIVLVFDEFQVLFSRTDKLGGVAAEALETLIRQGRGFGIHVILGSQSLAGLDALGAHVPQLLPVRILLPASESDAAKVLGEGNTEGSALTSAGEGILNTAAGAVEANERFRGALIDEADRRRHVATARAKADQTGFLRRPVVFEGNAPIPAERTRPADFADEIRGADPRTLRLRFGTPMAVMGTADLDLRRESGGNVLLVARDQPQAGVDGFSLPQAVAANVTLSAVARRAAVEVVDFMPIEEGLESFLVPLLEAGAATANRRRAVPELLTRIDAEVQKRVAEDDTAAPPLLLVLYGMHRARDFDPDSVDFDSEVDLPELLARILRDGPEVGVHAFLWFDSVAGIARRLPAGAVREASWRIAGRMSEDDSISLVGSEAATSLRDQQLVVANEDRGILQRCTAISQPGEEWTRELLAQASQDRKEPIG
ncbi:MAG: hypothetical protein BGO11_07435 [Solirubrobacterales bacterium 70-9]|nr:MAG: hypothetical protein BGO11_07435 [Solirubrobacterales bacterium 70-9]